jgi:uncharacterized membrane protein YecN with MAPEG domain
MATQNLFLPVCGTCLILMTLIAAILGMKSRIKFANQLFRAYKNNENIEGGRAEYLKKQRILLIIAVFSILGILLLPILILIGILSISKTLLVILITLIVICVACGVLLTINSKKLDSARVFL